MNTETFETHCSIPNGLRVYAIGDIHGHLTALDKMHEAISFDLIEDQPERAHIVYLGDYVDRGPDSKGVLDRLIERRDRGDGIEKTFLMGNHEQGMLEFMNDPEGPIGSIWLDWGGKEAIASYGITFQEDVILPAEKLSAASMLKERIGAQQTQFLNNCETHIQIGDYIFAHAGVDPTKLLSEQTLQDLLFNREPFMSWTEKTPYMVVHGHTITPDHEPEVKSHRICVDTGLYEGGPLSTAVLERNQVRFLQVQL